MNLFEISYDIVGATPEAHRKALRDLLSIVVGTIKGTSVRRFVQTTLVFGTERGYFEVLAAVKSWSDSCSAFFVVSQIMPNEDGRRFYYTMRKNESLQQEVDVLVKEIESSGAGG